MSYILDALRKSESERQRDAGTGLARTPLAAGKHKTPAWIWIVIGVLSLALIGIAAAWWRSNPGDLPLAQDTATGIGQEPPAASADQSADRPPAQPAAADADRLRSIAELPDFGPTLPEYRLEVLACCSSDPAENSAWINGRRYYPGERIGSGPVVAEVRPDGVVLVFAGQRFLLTTR